MVVCELFLIFAEKYKTINHMLDKERGLYIAHCANGALSIAGHGRDVLSGRSPLFHGRHEG